MTDTPTSMAQTPQQLPDGRYIVLYDGWECPTHGTVYRARGSSSPCCSAAELWYQLEHYQNTPDVYETLADAPPSVEPPLPERVPAAAARLRKVIDRKIRRSRVRDYEPTMVTVSIADLETLIAASRAPANG